MTEIWQYTRYYKYDIADNNRLSLGEGNTPLQQATASLSQQLGLQAFFFKREDLNPTGSHKDRSTAFLISAYIQQGLKNFVISSSGNAAISASRYCKQGGVSLTVFLSPSTPKEKINLIESVATIKYSDRPMSDAIKFARTTGAKLLRNSTDEYALEGTVSLGIELFKDISSYTRKLIDGDSLSSQFSIFVPASSGTLAQGIYEGIKRVMSDETTDASLNEVQSNIKNFPALHIVQTTKINTLVAPFDKDFEKAGNSIAQAIVDRVGHRKTAITDAINDSHGSGWVVSDKEILEANKMLESEGIQCSYEGAMSLAGLIKAKKNGWKIENAVCIITGARR